MHGRIPGDCPQTIADWPHRVKFEDDQFPTAMEHNLTSTKKLINNNGNSNNNNNNNNNDNKQW